MGASDGGDSYNQFTPTAPAKPIRNGIFRDKPTYKHSCDGCVYQFTYAFQGKEVDVHKCSGAILGGVVFRLSNEPSDETTMFESVIMRMSLDRKHAEELRAASEAKTMANYGAGTFYIVNVAGFAYVRSTL